MVQAPVRAAFCAFDAVKDKKHIKSKSVDFIGGLLRGEWLIEIT